jgi:hypothetical protein
MHCPRQPGLRLCKQDAALGLVLKAFMDARCASYILADILFLLLELRLTRRAEDKSETFAW